MLPSGGDGKGREREGREGREREGREGWQPCIARTLTDEPAQPGA